MASNLFKTRYLPNPDGTDSTTALTNANTAFVHTYLGDDNTGDGTREKPYRSMTKANLKSVVSYIVFRGVINEYFYTTKTIIGDDINQMIIMSNYSPLFQYAHKITTEYLPPSAWLMNNVISNKLQPQNAASNSNWTNVLFKEGMKYDSYTASIFYSTFRRLFVSNNSYSPIKNSIIYSLSLYNAVYDTIKYSALSSVAVFKIIDANIVVPNFTEDSKTNISLLKNSYKASGINDSNLASIFPKDTFDNETCLVIKEQRAGGSHPNVFNKYAETLTGTLTSTITQNQAKTSIQLTVADSSKFPVTGDVFIPFTGTYTNNGASITDGNEVFTYTSVTINSATLITLNGASYTFKMAHANATNCTRYGDVLDFTLNPDPLNEALWASDTGGYVGCFRPAVDGIINQAASIIDVNADGTDTANAGNLIQVDASGNLVFNTLSTQLWNRFRDVNCVEIKFGSKFNGLNAMSNDGSPFGTYLGKKQNLIDATVVNPGDALTVGTMYKVFNDSAQDVTKAIIYNSVQYLPEYTFMCLSGITTFSLLNTGSGTYVKKVNADVLESIEILPYDNATTPSAFPKFSAPLMGECKLLYYTAAGATRYGKTAGNPVLFGDLAVANMITDFGTVNDKMGYYDGYAISNADQEFFTLANPSLTSPKSTYFTTAIPVLRFLKREINAHFDLPYDY